MFEADKSIPQPLTGRVVTELQPGDRPAGLLFPQSLLNTPADDDRTFRHSSASFLTQGQYRAGHEILDNVIGNVAVRMTGTDVIAWHEVAKPDELHDVEPVREVASTVKHAVEAQPPEQSDASL